jgi:TatD DNase family protein
MIDTHAHLNFKAFDKDRDKVIQGCLKENIWMINVGTNFLSSKKAVEIAQEYKRGVYASIGLHPINIEQEVRSKKEENIKPEDILERALDYEKYKKLAQNEKVVAIGEIGLDYYLKPKAKRKLKEFKDKQKEIFLKQLALAEEFDLPVIFHCRMAHPEFMELLKQKFVNQKIKGVIHCFTGNLEQAKQYLKMGLYLGFNGIIFKLNLDEVIKNTPLDRILVETDSPYLAPPKFNSQRNDPRGVKFVIKKIAQIKNKSFKKIAQITTKNASQLFGFNKAS